LLIKKNKKMEPQAPQYHLPELPQYDLPDLPQYDLPDLRGRRGKQRRDMIHKTLPKREESIAKKLRMQRIPLKSGIK
jgi:hypothetical protein